MSISIPILLAAMSLIISLSAFYNAYLFHGGKLAWSEMLIALGMLFLAISLGIEAFFGGVELFPGIKLADVSATLGMVSLLAASIKLRSSIKA